MRLLLIAVVVAFAVPTATASADGFYFTESYGGTKVKDELSAYFPEGTFRVRVAVGMRRGHWALDAFVTGDMTLQAAGVDSVATGPDGDGPAPSRTSINNGIVTYGLDLKYLAPLARHLDAYVRGSASSALLSGDVLDGYHGRGLGFGAGVQLKGKVSALGLLCLPLFFSGLGPKITGALYVDEGYDFLRFQRSGSSTIDAQLTHLTFGFALGSDF